MNYTTFIEGLEDMLQISDFPDEAKEEIVTTLSQNILTRTNLAIASVLSEEEAKMMNDFLEKGMLEESMNLLSEKHPELDDIVVSVSKEVVDEFLKAGE
jgi:signal recognition particle GTPase